MACDAERKLHAGGEPQRRKCGLVRGVAQDDGERSVVRAGGQHMSLLHEAERDRLGEDGADWPVGCEGMAKELAQFGGKDLLVDRALADQQAHRRALPRRGELPDAFGLLRGDERPRREVVQKIRHECGV